MKNRKRYDMPPPGTPSPIVRTPYPFHDPMLWWEKVIAAGLVMLTIAVFALAFIVLWRS